MKSLLTKLPTWGVRFSLALLALATVMAPSSAAQDSGEIRLVEWPSETVELFSSLPVQSGGRIKPLDSLAGLNLLMMNGKRTLSAGIDWSTNADGELVAAETQDLKPSAWLLDCFFFPDQARTYRAFRIQDSSILTSIGLEPRKKRDWYSFNELLPGLNALDAEANKARRVEPKKRSPKQGQTIKLSQDILNFERLLITLEPLRHEYSTGSTELFVGMFGLGKTVGVAGLLEHEAGLRDLRRTLLPSAGADYSALIALMDECKSVMRENFGSPAFIPPHPHSASADTWLHIGDLMGEALTQSHDHSDQLKAISSLEIMMANRHNPEAFHKELEVLHANLSGQATARGEYKHIEQEVALYRMDPFTNGLVFFLLAFIAMAASWLKPNSKPLWYGQIGLAAIGLTYLTIGIVYRCVIRERPPVVTLYDTILFITAVAVLVAFGAEWITRRRVAMAGGVVIGLAGLFLAGKYELKEIASSGDTMASVVAVLDTNFYLAIHVTTIAMGYAGGLLAALIAHAWILGKVFGLEKGDKALYATIYKMTYGVICFSLLFSIFGTIMGGIWANDSWGRFWGWDPKENGALLICIWQLLTLHLRLGGYIRARGFAVMSVLGGIVVSASWWGVNLLGVGLHSYGFTSGVALSLFSFWAVELLVVALCGFNYIQEKNAKVQQTQLDA